MRSFALIINNKVHVIEEINAISLGEVYEKYRSRDLVYIDVTDDTREIQEGWPFINGNIVEPEPEPEPQIALDELKAQKWAVIKAKRDSLEQSGVPYMGKILDSDPISVQRISIAVQAAQASINAGQPITIDWTCADNTVLTMTAQQICGIPVALAQYSNNLHQIARGLREQIEAATTADEVAAIAWPT